MTNDEKRELLNIKICNNNCSNHSKELVFNEKLTKLPKTLYKYRKFDDYTFDMIKRNYIYLCPAGKLDDSSECDTSLDLEQLYDLEKNNLKRECLLEIIEMVRPFTSNKIFEAIKSKILSISYRNGTVNPSFLLDLSDEIKDMAPECDVTLLVNQIVSIPEKLNDPRIKSQIEKMISIGYLAKDELGICSLCDSPRNDLLWEKYANESTGYCIEYDVSNYEYQEQVYPVFYTDDRRTNLITPIVRDFINQLTNAWSNGHVVTDISNFLRLFLTKNTQWEYQNEWRILGDAGAKMKSPRIKAIYLGKNVSKINRKSMRLHSKKYGFALFE